MLRKNKPIKRRNSSNSKEEDRKRQLEEFLSRGQVKKLEYRKPESRILKKGDLKHDHRCSYCDGWENEDGEFQHYDYCPKNKGSRRNPITSTKVNRFSPIADLDLGKTSKSNVVINYEDKEIVFTGNDASDVRDIIKYQLSLFRSSSKLQKRYPGNQLNGGGFYLYLTEILRDIYPRYFK